MVGSAAGRNVGEEAITGEKGPDICMTMPPGSWSISNQLMYQMKPWEELVFIAFCLVFDINN